MRKVPYHHPEQGLYTNRRRWVGLSFFAILVGIPFLVIDGASFFLFNFTEMEFHLFFRVFPFTQFYVLLALTFSFIALLVYSTVIWGRVWCGWMCPQTIISDFLRVFEKFWLPRKNIKGIQRVFRQAAAYLTMSGFVLVVSLDIIWYFITPYDFFSKATAGTLSSFALGSLAVTFLVTWIDMVWVRQSFCEYLCPYAKMQGSLFSETTTVVAYDQERGATDCTKCMMCVRVCPSGIDIRDGLQMACIACAACIDACEPIMAKKGKPTLVRYWSESKIPSLLKDRSLILAGLGVVAFLFVIWQIFFKVDMAVSLSRNAAFTGKQVGDQIVNGYILTIDNLAQSEKHVTVSVEPAGFKLLPPVENYLIRGTETARLPIIVETSNENGNSGFILVVRDDTGYQKEIKQGFFRGK